MAEEPIRFYRDLHRAEIGSVLGFSMPIHTFVNPVFGPATMGRRSRSLRVIQRAVGSVGTTGRSARDAADLLPNGPCLYAQLLGAAATSPVQRGKLVDQNEMLGEKGSRTAGNGA